ncbi:hypothetical protein BDV19DRAFT_390536 [Aspergillus venezuelensis]
MSEHILDPTTGTELKSRTEHLYRRPWRDANKHLLPIVCRGRRLFVTLHSDSEPKIAFEIYQNEDKEDDIRLLRITDVATGQMIQELRIQTWEKPDLLLNPMSIDDSEFAIKSTRESKVGLAYWRFQRFAVNEKGWFAERKEVEVLRSPFDEVKDCHDLRVNPWRKIVCSIRGEGEHAKPVIATLAHRAPEKEDIAILQDDPYPLNTRFLYMGPLREVDIYSPEGFHAPCPDIRRATESKGFFLGRDKYLVWCPAGIGAGEGWISVLDFGYWPANTEDPSYRRDEFVWWGCSGEDMLID